MTQIENWFDSFFLDAGLPESLAIAVRLILFLLILLAVSGIAFYATKQAIQRLLYRVFEKTPVTWDDTLAEKRVFNHLAHIVPAIFLRLTASTVFADVEFLLPFIIKITDAYLIVVGMMIFFAILRVAEHNLASHPLFKDKPLTSYFQLIRIILYIVTLVLILSVILEKSPVYFLSAFGAMTAILLLVFKDTIMGLVASVQMSANDTVRVGDWVEMPKFGADGDVIAINLNTVKIQNWDKTISTIPTYYFMTDSFKNWRGMQQSGGRRIKRAIRLDTQSVRFVDDTLRGELRKIYLLKDFLEERQKIIDAYNEKHAFDMNMPVNGRRMTNLGVYRAYVESYIKHHPRIHQGMTILVRQLPTEGRGIPMEIYCFTDTTNWGEYESIQADIFDHLFAATGVFGLDIFQEPGGQDFTRALSGTRQG